MAKRAVHGVQFVAISFADNTVGIMQFVLNPNLPQVMPAPLVGYDAESGRREATDEAINSEIARSAFPQIVISWRRISAEDVPADRTYRDAWVDDGSQLVHDMPRARELHRQALRAERVTRLVKLDADWMAATRAKNKARVAEIDAHKQALLDVTDHPGIEAAQTVEELKRVTLPETP